jgi:hypothetical protein
VSRGVFWVIEKKLYAFPFDGSYVQGIAKSGKTYNHEKLWEYVRPKGCNKPFDYYPRGRVDYTGKGKAVIYLSPYIDDSYNTEIIKAFGITENPVVRHDYSKHYRCYLDEEK